MPDYIPSSDGEFLPWEQNFLTYATAHVSDLGLEVGDLTPLVGDQTAWQAALAASETKQVAARAAVQLKADKKAEFASGLRSLVRRLQASPVVTDEQRRALGITVHDSTATALMAAPPSRPVGMVDTSQRLRHEVRFVDENTPTRRAKPATAKACEIWMKIGAAPVDPGELVFVAAATASPYVVEYSGADAGKMAYYMLRWIGSRGEKGPWSETVAATVTG